jgi:glycosyltransferase involved in cell wall biosynthesis
MNDNNDKIKTIITVVICTYNRWGLLKRTLDSLLEQEISESFDYEVLLVDNNSDDRTKEVVESYLPRFYGKLKYLFEPKQGKSYALNRALIEAKGEVIAFTDDDCIVDNKWLEYICKSFLLNEVKCVGGRIVPIWEIDRPRWLIRRLYGRLALLDYGDKSFKITDDKHNIYGANMAFRKDLFVKYGLFDTELGRKGKRLYSGEDSAFIYNIVKNKENVMYQADLIVQHFISKDRMNKKYFRKWHYDAGISSAILVEQEDKKKIIYSIPRYKIKIFIITLVEYLKALILFKKELFFFECRLIYFISYFKCKLLEKVKGKKI